MAALLLSLVALVVGPLLHHLALRRRTTLAALDGFVFVAITGLVLLHILPTALRLATWSAALAGLGGFLVPGAAERLAHRAAAHVHLLFLVVAMLGFGFHTFLDGVALSSPQTSAGGATELALAIVIHRLPDGLAIWWLLRAPYGVLAAAGTLGVMAAATVAGYVVGGAVLLRAAPSWLGIVQALVAGSLVHVVLHRPHASAEPSDRAPRIASIIGGLAALGLLWSMERLHEEDAAHSLSWIGLVIFALLLALRFGAPRWMERVFTHRHNHDADDASHPHDGGR
jgi:uncharacterized protein